MDLQQFMKRGLITSTTGTAILAAGILGVILTHGVLVWVSAGLIIGALVFTPMALWTLVLRGPKR